MLDLEVVPERSLGCEGCEFKLGMPFAQAVQVLQRNCRAVSAVDVIYVENDPLAADLILKLSADGIRLIFDSCSQRLKIIEVYDVAKVKLKYGGNNFCSPEVQPTREQIDLSFGATRSPDYDSNQQCFVLSFRGLSFSFPAASNKNSVERATPAFPNRIAALVSKMAVFSGSLLAEAKLVFSVLRFLNRQFFGAGSFSYGTLAARLHEERLRNSAGVVDHIARHLIRTSAYRISAKLAETAQEEGFLFWFCSGVLDMPWHCFHGGVYLHNLTVIRDEAKTLGIQVRLMFEGLESSSTPMDRLKYDARTVHFGNTVQDVLSCLGAPGKVFYKSEDKMKIHAPPDQQLRRTSERSDYFFNYFTLGLDILFDAVTQRAKKFVLHTNYPGHYDFNIYYRCMFEICLVKSSNGEPVAEASLMDQTELIMTPFSKYDEIHSHILGTESRPIVLNRSNSVNATNPFGPTYCYGYQDMILEFMPNGHIASVTLYQIKD